MNRYREKVSVLRLESRSVGLIRTICTEQKVSSILSFAPLDLVDLFFDFERLEVVELWLVRLELGVELVLAALFLLDSTGGRRGKQSVCETRRQTAFRSQMTTAGATYRVIALEENDTTTLVTCSQIVTGMVKLDRRDDIGC